MKCYYQLHIYLFQLHVFIPEMVRKAMGIGWEGGWKVWENSLVSFYSSFS